MNRETLEAIDELAKQEHVDDEAFYDLFAGDGAWRLESTYDAAASAFAELRRLHRERITALALLEMLHDGKMEVRMPADWDPETVATPPPFEQLEFRGIPPDDWPRGEELKG